MIRRHTTALRASLMAADFLAALALFVVASLLRYGADWEVDWQRLGLHPWLAALAYAGGWVTLVLVNGLYRVRARYAFRSEASRSSAPVLCSASGPSSTSSSGACRMPAGC